MRSHVRVSLVQFEPRWLEREANAEAMSEAAEMEAQNGSDLIVFPELANIGYITPVRPGDPPAFQEGVTAGAFAELYLKASEPIPGPTSLSLLRICKKYGCHVIVGISQTHPRISGTLYNSAVLLGPGGVLGVHHKVHMPLNEKLFFYPGDTLDVHSTPLGNIALSICYDARFPELSRVQALKGAEIMCSIWATPLTVIEVFADLEAPTYRAHVRAQENGVYYLICNRRGNEGGTDFSGRSAISAPNGRILVASKTGEEEVLTADLGGEEIPAYRLAMGIFHDRRPELYAPIVAPLSERYEGASGR